ncbi:MAG: shikimate dehydrogenase, partial [Clostridiales bacterium]|nr:shikimate dehydrogenase [Clostridiales bacterium]
KNKKVVLLGSGGAARAIAVESALKDIAEITIINRTLEKAEEIVEIIKNNTKVVARAIKMQSVQNIPSCDLLINATSIGLASDSEMPNINYDDISSDMMVQDVVINPVETSFLRQAEQRGAAISTGLDMLVYQGKIGIRLWTGHEVDVDILKGSLRNE